MKLRKWVKVVLLLLLFAVVSFTIYKIFTIETTYETPVGEYTCRGKIIQVCSGNEEVKRYLGI